MKNKLPMQIIAVLFLCLISGCSQKPVDVTDEITQANETLMKAFNTGDMDVIMSFYSEGAKLFPSNSDIIEGKQNIEAFWNIATQMGVKSVNFKTLSASGFGNIAIEEGRYTMYAEGETIVDKGKYIVTWEKVDDRWLVTRDIWNTSMPAPEVSTSSSQ